MKKWICTLLSVMMIAVCLTGCGSKGEEKTKAADADKAAAKTETATEAPKEDASSSFDASNTITVVSREEGSGTRGAFIELFGVEEKDANGNKTDRTTGEAVLAPKTDVALTNVASDQFAIGYISLGSLNDTVKALKINGVDATVENIKSKKYEISRPFNIATKKGKMSDAAQDFMNYIMSKEGQQIIEDNKYIKIDEAAKEFKSNNAKGKVVVAGSSSVTPVMEKLKEAYANVNKNITVEVQQSDSTTGMQAAMEGTCDIGMASRDLKDSELEKLEPTVIALDGIAVIVNKENPTEDLSKDQVKAIYVGDVTTWEDATK
ncbi:phosphate ABC transporter, periplasmic phosphate-binding protein PstS [Lachnospiraceae bacterium KM106-2]|nr:phosphate ABC transporter, periplasmic phosphate-binding protein PstS [Lachnospiraceae bacterium KM106-2]